MNESKIELTERLRREGRWAEESRYKDDVRRQLRDEGKSRSAASDEAWEAMEAKYAPLPDSTQPAASSGALADGDDADIEAVQCLVEQSSGERVDMIRDAQRVYKNTENRRLSPTDAPSPGAWGLL